MSKVLLSERIRPNCEATPWLIEEIKKMEAQHAETLRLLEEMIEEKTEGPFFHEDEHGPESVLNRARAHLAAHAGKGRK